LFDLVDKEEHTQVIPEPATPEQSEESDYDEDEPQTAHNEVINKKRYTTRYSEATTDVTTHALITWLTVHIGRIKVTKRQELADCSLSGDLKLRSALTRRALAYELAGIASFLTLEKWSNMLFEKLQTDPPPGYRFVNHEQLIRADKALWLKVAEETRARVQTGATLAKPVDVAIEKWCIHPEVQLYLMNMPSNSSGATTVPPKTDPPVLKKPPKTVLKDQTDKTVKGKS
ncbi:unnamed protein product, partial [Durusdinium trenchii]